MEHLLLNTPMTVESIAARTSYADQCALRRAFIALNETLHTPALPAELGLSYVLDWTCDDQPFRL